MRFVLLCILALMPQLWLSAQIEISEARARKTGDTVTIQGIVTNGDELGPIRYLQDDTGGLPAYAPGDFSNMAQRGHVVTVTGVLKDFNSLLEIDPVLNFAVISTGNPLPDPKVVTPSEMTEAIEGQLVVIHNATLSNAGGTFTNGTYTITASGQTTQLFVRAGHPLIGKPIPLAKVALTGIASQFRTNYQLLPRDINDIRVEDAFFFVSEPTLADIAANALTVAWETNLPGTTRVEYGTTTALGQVATQSGSSQRHSIEIAGLQPATFYYVRAMSENNGLTISSRDYLFCTASTSSGRILVYFNHKVDPSFSNGASPVGQSASVVENAIIEKINSAQKSVELAMYSNNRGSIVSALNAAFNRGVKVRYVTDTDASNDALKNPAPDFKFHNVNPEALMHNKFVVIDADLAQDAWVLTGSMNFTTGEVVDNYNNYVFIQDQSLARTYRHEFEEMWGGSGDTPGYFLSKSGSLKKDNTPHQFKIGGIRMESYFSPSDHTTSAIERAIKTANKDFQFGLLTMTRNELGSAAVEMHKKGVGVRGIIENVGDQGTEYQFLLDNNVAVEQHDLPYIFHHKYGIIDATAPASDPIVVFGSHNWTTAAETVNDENTLIVHDANFANIYLQEFELRWCELTAPNNCLTSLGEKPSAGYANLKIYPNPATNYIQIENPAGLQHGKWVTRIFSQDGRMVKALFGTESDSPAHHQLAVSELPSGKYIIMLENGVTRFLGAFQKI